MKTPLRLWNTGMRVALAAICALILSACKPDPVPDPDPDPKPLTVCETPGPTASKTPDWDWEVRSVVQIPHLSTVTAFFIDSLTGYLGTNQLLKTTDGGKTWASLPLQANDVPSAIYFTDLQHGFVFGQKRAECATGCENFIMRTVDGGQTWERTVLSGIGKFYFNEVYMADNLNGIAYGADGVNFAYIFRTSDGGLTWQSQHLVIGGNALPGNLLQPGSGILALTSLDSLYLSKDLFQTWEVFAKPRFFRVLFESPGFALAAGDDYWMTSTDTGRTWQRPVNRKIFPLAINKNGGILSQVMGGFCQPNQLGLFPATWASIETTLVTKESEPFAGTFFNSVQRVGKYIFAVKPLWSDGEFPMQDQVQVIRITDNHY